MTIEYRDTEVVFAEIVGVEDAEVLLAWLQERSPVQADFSACTHMHPANIQVLMAAGVQVVGRCADAATSSRLSLAQRSRLPPNRRRSTLGWAGICMGAPCSERERPLAEWKGHQAAAMAPARALRPGEIKMWSMRKPLLRRNANSR